MEPHIIPITIFMGFFWKIPVSLFLNFLNPRKVSPTGLEVIQVPRNHAVPFHFKLLVCTMHAASQLWSIVWNFFKSYGVPKWIFADHRGSKNLLDFVIDYSNCQMGPIWCLAVICRDIFWLCFYGHKKPDAPLFGILSKVRGIRVQKLRSLATNSIYSLDEAIDAIW